MMFAKRIALLAAAVALATGTMAGCGKTPEASAASKVPAIKPVPVTVLPAKADAVQRSVHVVGALAAYEKAVISNRVTGTVAEIYKDVGDRVAPNEKLLLIGPRRFELAVEEAKQQLAETLARLGYASIPEDEKIEETAPVRKAQTELETSRLKFEKAKPLYDQKVMREFEYTDIANGVKVAESNLQAARETSRALVAQARGLLTMIELKKKDLDDTVLLAPNGKAGDGTALSSYVVTARSTSQGEYLREGSTLFMLMADQLLKLQAHVPERYLAQIAVKNLVRFEIEAYPGRKFEGTITVIDPAVDPANRTFMIEATVDNAKGELRPGSFVQGDILVRKEDGVVLVPVRAIASFVGENRVYVVDGSGEKAKSRQVNIEMGQQVGDWVEAIPSKSGTASVKAGDLVAVDGLTKLVDGAPVIVQDRKPVGDRTSTAPTAAEPEAH